MSVWKKLKYGSLSVLLALLSFMPLCLHRAFGALAGFVMQNIVGYRRNVALKNIRNAFPEKSDKEIDGILRKFYRYLGTMFCEAIWFGSCRNNKKRLRRSRICELRGQECLNAYLRRGKSVMVLVPHMGNFEVFSGIVTYSGDIPLEVSENHFCVSYKELHNKFWNDFMFRNRLSGLLHPSGYDGLVESMKLLRYVYKHKDDSYVFHFITDQYPYSEGNNAEVEFFNQKTVSMTAGAAMAKMLAMPVLYMRMFCRPEGGYTMEYLPICDDASVEDIQDITQRYYRMIEDDIRTQPWNYLWTHKRWKTLNY